MESINHSRVLTTRSECSSLFMNCSISVSSGVRDTEDGVSMMASALFALKRADPPFIGHRSLSGYWSV